MTRTRIKICGVRDEAAARAAVAGGADAVGFVFVESSVRCVEVPVAARVAGSLAPFVEPVGLFADASATQILQICHATGLHTVQLHGHEPITILDDLPGLRVIKALAFDADAIDTALAWDADPRVSALLFDAARGGSGEAIDWHALSAAMPGLTKPILLAGGLNPDNVAQAIEVVRPYGVDVSSGVEQTRGEKDATLIAAFCEAVQTTR